MEPGSIDEVDVTWFNGEIVGARGNIQEGNVDYWNQPREYRVPSELVQAGKNVIAVRVIDAMGQGGLWGDDPDLLQLTPVDGQTSERIGLAGEWKLKAEYALPDRPQNRAKPNQPSVLYNQMIAPLIPYGIRGAIWYQGEANTARAEQYQTLLPTMIEDWRVRWGRGDFPFLIVQLANFKARKDDPSESNWAELREAQAMTAANDPNAGLAVAIDIGEADDIHPKNKQDVGKRLGLEAERIAYGHSIVSQGPTFRDMRVQNDAVILRFDHAEGGLVCRSSDLGGFALRGAAGDFVWANAEIDGATVRLSAEGVVKPVAVRYGWAATPEAPLYNQSGLPMVPFRTDASK